MNKIEEKYGLKQIHAIALFVIFVLNVICIACNFIKYAGNITFHFLINVLMYAGVVYYACKGYKKPHGNLMRYLLILYAVSRASSIVLFATKTPEYVIVDYLAITILTTYMAGRLDHYKQNIVISIIVLICNCVATYFTFNKYLVSSTLTPINAIACFETIVAWLAIAGAYITRFKLHKQAGFEDKK